MKKTRLLLISLSLLVLCAFLFAFSYREAREEAIRNINIQQQLHARQAAQGIEDFFTRWTGILAVMAKSSHVIDLDQTGREAIENAYRTTQGPIRGITRVDGAGRILHTVPFDRDLIGRDISYQNHVQEVMRTRKTAVSDVFTAVQGYQAVALHVPVFKDGAFRGTIGVTIDFRALAARYLEVIRIGKTGYAWVISRDGTELYCPVPGHTGRLVYINCEKFPSVLAMASEMTQGRQGATTYTFDQIGGQTVKTVKKHAVYMPIALGNTFWSIVVASSEEEILAPLADFRNRLLLLISLFLMGALLFAYYGLKAWFIVRENERRLKTEGELRESEARFRSLIENAPEALFVHADGIILYANQMAVNLFGAKDADQLIGSSILDRIHPDLHDVVRERLRVLYEGSGKLTPLEQTYVRLDGTEIPVEASAVSILYERRKATLTFARDITKRKQLDRALRESEETFRKAFFTTPDAVNINRLSDGMFVSVNEGFSRITGYSEAEVIGRLSLEVDIWANPEDRERLVAGLKKEGVVKNLDAAYRMKNGEIRFGLMSAVVIELAGVPHIISITRDITDRVQAQEKLRESQALLSAVFDQVQAGIILIDPATHRIVNANRAAEQMCGVADGEMTGKVCHQYICPAAAGRCPITDGHQPVDRAEKVLTTADGKEIPVLKTAAPVRIADRDYLLESFIDMREHKRLEAQLLQAQKMEAIGTLAGGIAHDFNNILMGIQGVASLMMLDPDPAPSRNERLKLIESQVRRGADLTMRLLGFARGGRYQVKPTDINEILEKSASMFGRTKKEIVIHRKYEEAVWTVDADQGQMEQVFLNLFVNAWQAMPGGGAIFLETQNVVLGGQDRLPEMSEPGRYVKISIGDTGMGMDQKTKERIFDPFFSTRGIGRGTGLGLAMVYGIVMGHKGMIDVSSEPGHGTTFHIFLPASEHVVVEEKPVSVVILKGTETILLVDDEKMVLEVYRDMLESLGYRVFPAGSGQEAIAVYMEKRGRIDLVILDMIMAGISGGETFDRLREIDPEVKVLLSSGYSLNGQAQEILDRGCRGFLHKPFTLEGLSRKVREVLKG